MPDEILLRTVAEPNLPTWSLRERLEDGTWMVAVPIDETTDGALDAAKIRTKYAGSAWDRADILEGVVP